MSYSLVQQAILTQTPITATYHGHYREMCPHVLGIKRGRPATPGRGRRPGRAATPDEEHVLCYQFGGTSNTGLRPDGSGDNWRCVRVSELMNVQLAPGPWHTAPNHSRPQNCVDDIDVEVN